MLEIFADYNQFYLQDESKDVDLSDSWGEESYKQMAVAGDGFVAVATARNMDVPVEVELCNSKPTIDFGIWDHVVQCGMDIPSGVIIIAGVSDYLPDAKRIRVEPGCYGVQLLYGKLNTLSEDGLEGDDYYKVVLWPAASIADIEVLKDSRFNR